MKEKKETPSKKIQKLLKTLPKNTGVYKMKNEEGRVLYIGKAKNIANRVRSYFQKSKQHSVKTKKMVSQINDIEIILVDSELEALILETNLIKELRPKYNILMKDDKNYVYIKITTNEDFPRITIVRKIEKDGAKYFGPKTSSQRTLKTLKTIKKLFPYRHCNLNIKFLPEAKIDKSNKLTWKNRVNLNNTSMSIPCLDYHIKRCIGPCIGIPTPKEYKLIIDQVIRFLEGKTDEVVKSIKEEMMNAAQNKKFELAAKIRDKLKTVESILETQKVSDPNQKNTDIINFITKEDKAFFNIFLIRDGKLINQEIFIVDLPDQKEEATPEKEILQSFLKQYYEKAADIGKEILIPEEIEEQKIFETYLSEIRGNKAKIIIPQKGKKNKLMELALKNAKMHADRNKSSWEKEEELIKEALKELQEKLKLSKKPQRIECYDISHFSGENTVASMIVLENGKPKNKDYRQFKIRTLPTGKSDDYASLAEALTRRLQKLSKKSTLPENISFGRAKKKETEELLETLKKANLDYEDLNYKEFLVLRDEKEKIIGLGKLKNYGKKEKQIEELSSIWISEEQRGKRLASHLVKLIIKKAKTNRLYLSTRGDLEEYFTNLGFRIIYKIPQELKEKDRTCKITCNVNPIFMVFDKQKGIDHSFKKKPDLILIDGGKGQLSTIEKVLKKLDLEKINLASIAKREEEIFIRGSKTPINLEKESQAQKILQKARDEAHRFANQYREKLQSKNLKKSILDEIEGLGPKIRTKLLKQFGSISGIKEAPEKEIEKICGPKLTKRLLKKI